MNFNATSLFYQVALFVFTPQCFDKYFIEFNYLDGPCFSATLSKCLGLGIILGSLLVKVPQIIKLFNNKSGEGISILSVTLDLTAITIYTSYSFVKQFPFSSWGDASFLAVQTVIVAILVLVYQNAVKEALYYLITYLSICYIMMSGITPLNVLWTLQTCNIGIVVAGKVIQAWTNFKNGHTGQLSAITMCMLFFGSAARIFTSIQETGDTVVILTYVAGTLANGLLVSQMWYYWNVQIKQKSE